MRKQTRRKPLTGLTPYEKAVVRRAWEADIVDASIHAFIGLDVRGLMQRAGGIIYAVMSACEEAGIEQSEPDVQLLHEAGAAILEMPGQTAIDRAQRDRVIAGLAASERLQPRLDTLSIRRAALEISKAGKNIEQRFEGVS